MLDNCVLYNPVIIHHSCFQSLFLVSVQFFWHVLYYLLRFTAYSRIFYPAKKQYIKCMHTIGLHCYLCQEQQTGLQPSLQQLQGFSSTTTILSREQKNITMQSNPTKVNHLVFNCITFDITGSLGPWLVTKTNESINTKITEQPKVQKYISVND